MIKNELAVTAACRYCSPIAICNECPLDGNTCANEKMEAFLAMKEERDKLKFEINALKPCLQQPTQDELNCMSIFSKAGYHWFVKDGVDGDVCAYKCKPYKDVSGLWADDDSLRKLPIDLSFLSWEDDEPYYFD